MTAKQLKLQLFQELSRRRRHAYAHAWSQYWRALQQFLLARIAVDEFQSLMELLLGDDRDLVELHNAFLVAILTQAHESRQTPADTSSSSKPHDAIEALAPSARGATAAAQAERSKRPRSNSASGRDEA